MNKVSLQAEQQLYVIDCGEVYSCLGFTNARDRTDQIARQLDRADLAFTDADHATLAGYQKYLDAIQAWGQSPLIPLSVQIEANDSSQHHLRLLSD